jgi:hypothetical protein
MVVAISAAAIFLVAAPPTHFRLVIPLTQRY